MQKVHFILSMMLILSKYIKLKIVFLWLRETLCILAKFELFSHRTYLVGSIEAETDKGRDQKKKHGYSVVLRIKAMLSNALHRAMSTPLLFLHFAHQDK